ncbi:hypothetical protein [Arsenophonus sp.]|uniref:hypothetical protein n=1 Tax=Arsenophonus sp. TaxID=1872640 RepID=UPI002858CE29|nr:hypothetical protein [Arsenophonus sp.]MDR5611152.1 ProQ/FINO family protein [Arsenophonus sp.]MDR5615133.1 ProQ/FINO family protein [Arsenophonus sp.]
MNPAPKKQVKKPKPQKPVKPVNQKWVEKPQPVAKVKIPIPPKQPKKRLKACLGSIGHHIDYRALIQLGVSRYDKDGQVAGEVTQADVEDNLKRLDRLNKSPKQPPDGYASLVLGK